MFTKLTGVHRAAIFTVLVLLMALVAALLFNALDIPSEGLVGLYMFTPPCQH